mgnify:CR=1 FL=1
MMADSLNNAKTFKSKSLQTKSLGGRGKLAIGVAIAGAVAVGAGTAIKKNNKDMIKKYYILIEKSY